MFMLDTELQDQAFGVEDVEKDAALEGNGSETGLWMDLHSEGGRIHVKMLQQLWKRRHAVGRIWEKVMEKKYGIPMAVKMMQREMVHQV
jgi:hypothetical protein